MIATKFIFASLKRSVGGLLLSRALSSLHNWLYVDRTVLGA